MKIKTLLRFLLLLFLTIHLTNCGTSKTTENAPTEKEALEILAKQNKEKQKAAKKEQKKAYKRYWKMQSKQAKKSIKRNLRNQKKRARQRKRA